MVAQIFSVYALRMAAVFLISQATLWLRTGVMPRWMALLTYALALVLLFIFTQSLWVVLASRRGCSWSACTSSSRILPGGGLRRGGRSEPKKAAEV